MRDPMVVASGSDDVRPEMFSARRGDDDLVESPTVRLDDGAMATLLAEAGFAVGTVVQPVVEAPPPARHSHLGDLLLGGTLAVIAMLAYYVGTQL